MTRRATAHALAARLEAHAAEWRRLPPGVRVGTRYPEEIAGELEGAARSLREVRDPFVHRIRRAVRRWLLEPTAEDRAYEHACTLNAGELLSQKVAAVFGPRIKTAAEQAVRLKGEPR